MSLMRTGFDGWCNQFHLKMIAIIAMVIDHVGWVFVPTESTLGQLMHFVGRLTCPIMCYFLAQGYLRSSDRWRYASRLFVFALLSQLPYGLMVYGYQAVFDDPMLVLARGNILFNLLLALGVLVLFGSKFSTLLKSVGLIFALFLSTHLDWGIYVIAFVLVLYYVCDDKNTQFLAYLVVAMGMLLLADRGYNPVMPALTLNWYPLGILLAPFCWYFYDGTLGRRVGGRYFFYAFYPAHMMILVMLAMVLDRL